MGESRQELLSWINDLLQLNLTKVEQCGTGAPLCQIFDSIFMDLPMSKVKFNANAEYQYISNFKVLQACFLQRKIEKTIPVERLIKCKFQDNLEFLQWVKKFWDQYFPGGTYDPVARRKGQAVVAGAGAGANPSSASGRSSSVASRKPLGGSGSGAAGSTIAPRTRTPSIGVQLSQLQAENATLREHAEGLERERDFYFNKLREIEILIQAAADEDAALAESGELTENSDKQILIKQVQDILYSTEEGFEIPEQATTAGEEEETF
ncbi:calponin homology domain-containing protein [Dipodascopsis uninucleata]